MFAEVSPLFYGRFFTCRKPQIAIILGRGCMPGEMVLRIWDVEHGACAMLTHSIDGVEGRLAMIDSGCTPEWRPSDYIKHQLRRSTLDYLVITNADQDHMSDLDGLWDEGITVSNLHRNPHPTADVLRKIKSAGGMSNDIERFLKIHATYNAPVIAPFNTHMGGITKKAFANEYPRFEDTNNLSLAVFISYGPFKILFPGDLETSGWLALLERDDFRGELQGVTVLVASHHGRRNGYCEEVFDYCRPQAIVMSDKHKAHSTQEMGPTYRQHVCSNHPGGVFVENTGKRRRVLTTRRDGWIHFRVNDQGIFAINTEVQG